MDTFEDKLSVFFLCFVLFAVTLYLRVGIVYPTEFVQKIISILSVAEDTLKIFGLSAFIEILKSHEPLTILILFSCFKIFISSLIVIIFKKMWEFSNSDVKNDLIKLIKFGTLSFITNLIIVLFFILSIVGIPIAILFAIIFEILIFLGSIPLSIYIGKNILLHYNFKINNLFVEYLFGSFIMLLLESIYFVGSTFIFFIFPSLSLGMFITVIVKYIKYGKYYFRASEKRTSFNRKHMKNIITKK